VKLATELDLDLERSTIAELDPLALPQDDTALGIRLFAHRNPLVMASALHVAEADEQPLDRLTAELARTSHAENGAKAIT
jgi:hypothetical protein